MAGDGLVETLPIGETAEMERLAPTVLVDICGEVVVAKKLVKNPPMGGRRLTVL